MNEQNGNQQYGVVLRAIIKSEDPRLLDEPLGENWHVYDVDDKGDVCRIRADTVVTVDALDRTDAVVRALEMETPELGLDAIPHDVSFWIDELNPDDVSVVQ